MISRKGALEGKTAIVTGGSTGIGRATALELAMDGADVVVASRSLDKLEKVAAEIKDMGRRSMTIAMDVTKKVDADAMVQEVLGEFGVVDILVNSAGGLYAERDKLFCESTEEGWDQTLAGNLKGVLNCTRAVINHMIQRRYGKIVTISSFHGMVGAKRRVIYSTAKAAIFGFTMSLAKEVAPYLINVNCVSPGPVEAGWFYSQPPDKSHLDRVTGITGLGRLGKPEDVAALVAFLVSDKASFITGQNYPVCGLSTLGA